MNFCKSVSEIAIFSSRMGTLIEDFDPSEDPFGLKTFIFEFFGFILTLDKVGVKK